MSRGCLGAMGKSIMVRGTAYVSHEARKDVETPGVVQGECPWRAARMGRGCWEMRSGRLAIQEAGCWGGSFCFLLSAAGEF